jgi:hypothetical protein
VASLVEAALEGFEVHEDDFSGEIRCAAELADVLGWAAGKEVDEAAVRSGILMINQMENTLKDYDSAPEVVREFTNQLVMIDSLLERAPTPDLRTRRQAESHFS